MRILLINPPYHAMNPRLDVGTQPPAGLIAIGGPLIDAGHEVRLLDAEVARMPMEAIVAAARDFAPGAIMTGHTGSTPAHPTVLAMARALGAALPGVPIAYGGVHPTYHAAETLAEAPEIAIVVRGEGEAIAVNVAAALAAGGDLAEVRGIAYRDGARVRLTPPALPIDDLDTLRMGWELIEDWDRYRCFGLGRSAILQLSRGCPHPCSYCGQRGFWTRQRYRTPEKLAAEIAWLHRTHGVRFVNLADENPTTSPRRFRAFLEAMAAERVDVSLFATIRAGDIVRDREILPLYRAAGFTCILMGMETTDAATLAQIRKGSTLAEDREAVRLLRANGILSMMGHIVGFAEDTDRTCWRALRQILLYDPDLLNAMYVTPHRWTPFYAESAGRGVIAPDLADWDYRHQVLSTPHLPPWRVLAWVKLTEALAHLGPRGLWRVLAHPDRRLRRALRWCYARAARVWLDEIWRFAWRDRRLARPVPLAEARGAPVPEAEYAMVRKGRRGLEAPAEVYR